MKNIGFIIGMFLFGQLAFGQTSLDVGSFTTLKVFDKIPVVLKASDTEKVEISGTKDNEVKAINKNGELKIRMSTSNLLQGDDVKVIVYFKTLNNIQANEGATIESSDVIKSSNLNMSVNSGAIIKLAVDAENLVSKANSGGTFELSGKVKNQTLTIFAGGNYEGKSLVTENTDVTTNAGGKATVYATNKIDAKTRAGGVINVYGNPTSVNKSNVAGGNINIEK